jgi:hypothetical protein
VDRFKTEETTRKTLLHQAAMGISGSDKTGSRAQSRRDREEKFYEPGAELSKHGRQILHGASGNVFRVLKERNHDI